MKRSLCSVYILFGVLNGSVCGVEDDAPDEILRDAIEMIEQRVTEGIARDGVGGATVGIIMGDKLVWTGSYGHADDEASTPAARDTVYRLASVTKPFTGLMLAQLVERGVVNYSDPVANYLPELAQVNNPWATGAPITILQLATMNSGLAREPRNLSQHDVGPVSEWQSAVLRAMSETSVEFEPGTRHNYSNIGFSMLGLAMERAANRPFIDYQLAEILRPLGMKDTTFEPDERLRPRLATGYRLGRDGSVNVESPLAERGYKIPAGGIYTTVDDLARLVMLHFGRGPNAVLGPAMLARLHSGFQSADADLSFGYGIGLAAFNRDGVVMIGHQGRTPGYMASMYFHPKTQIGIIMLRNASGNVFGQDAFCFDVLGTLVKKVQPELDALIARAESLCKTRQWVEAVDPLSELRKRLPLDGETQLLCSYALLVQAADLPAAIDANRAAFDLDYAAPMSAYYIASASALLGRNDEAIQWLQTAFERGWTNRSVLDDSDFDSIRDDPRFKAMIKGDEPDP